MTKINEEQNSIIEIQENRFLNYYGLSKSGLSDDFLKRTFNHLVSLASREEINAYVFIDGPLTINMQYEKFVRLGLLTEKNVLKYFLWRTWLGLLYFVYAVATSKRMFTPWDNFGFYGFFCLRKAKPISQDNYVFLYPHSDAGFVHGYSLGSKEFLILSKEDLIECKSNILLLTDQTSIGMTCEERMLSEIYFHEDDFLRIITPYTSDVDVIKENISAMAERPDNLQPSENELSDQDYVSKTEAIIISAMFQALTINDAIKYPSDLKIIEHLNNRFPSTDLLSFDFFERRLVDGRENLDISFDSLDNQYKTNVDLKPSAQLNERIVIAALAEVILEDFPTNDNKKPDKQLFNILDKCFLNRVSFTNSTVSKRLAIGRGELNINRR